MEASNAHKENIRQSSVAKRLVIGRRVLRVGQFVTIDQRVCEILSLDRNLVTISWFYFPDDTLGKRQNFHSIREVFSTNHIETKSVSEVGADVLLLKEGEFEAVDWLCSVVPVYFTRQFYDVETGGFEPEIDLFCTCQMPYNPDRTMVACDRCGSWFHCECLKLTPEQAKSRDFVCLWCRENV